MTKRIKIAVNTRFLISGKLEGIGTYSQQVLKRLVLLMPEVEFHFLFDRAWSEEFIYAKNVIPHQIGLPARHPILWYFWFENTVSNWLRKNDVDLFLSLDSFLSLNTHVKSFLVMHDLAYEHFPKHNSFLVRKYYQYFFPKYAARADKIFAVSKYTKHDIIKSYKQDGAKIELAYCGVSEEYKALSEEEQKQIRAKYSNQLPYYICIGSLNPRKNIIKAIEAFNLFKKEQESEHQLVIVGAKAWKTEILFKQINASPYQKDIILTGHLKPKLLSKFLASATALIYPSLFEGFGIPIIEAYRCEVPVICSNKSSTQEIGVGAAIMVSPTDVNQIKEAMLKVYESRWDKETCIASGKEKLKQYNWDKTATIFKDAIEKEVR